MLETDLILQQDEFRLEARFRLPLEGISALFGPSGSGKSSLLALLAGLTRGQGRVVLDGKVMADSAAGIFVAPQARGFGMVFQEARLFPHLSAGGNLDYALKRAPEKRFSIEDVAAFFDIAQLLGRPVGNLSGGEKARVALARALLSAPDFLLLDEPFAALDGARRRAFIAVLTRAHRKYGIPMLVVSHNIDDAAAMASHLIALDEGKVVAQGSFAQVAQEDGFQALLDPRDIGSVLSPSALLSGKADLAAGLWLRADHVLIATEVPHALSARNIVEGRVAALKAEAANSLLVTLETMAGPILARVTKTAARELDLAPGRSVWAVIKAHSV
jgi:molybdate transport system ATP-binding protein